MTGDTFAPGDVVRVEYTDDAGSRVWYRGQVVGPSPDRTVEHEVRVIESGTSAQPLGAHMAPMLGGGVTITADDAEAS